ncbi:hypothetical protein MAR_024801, partial [Mya arenaria]
IDHFDIIFRFECVNIDNCHIFPHPSCRRRWWDRFQMMPREQVSSSATFQAVFRFFKVICYMFFIIALVCSAAVSKLCVLLMTSGITKDPQPEHNWPAKTQLVISMCFPYGIWFLVYSAKSLFGSTAWPSLPLLTSVGFHSSVILK